MTESKQERPRTEFLTARQLAEVLQVSETTVYRLYRSGKIPHVRITDRIIRFHIRDVRHALGGVKHSNDHQEATEDDNQMSFDDLFSDTSE